MNASNAVTKTSQKPTSFEDYSEADLNKVLVKFVPKDQPSPKAYLDLVRTQIMGVDKNNKPRPLADFVYFLNVAKRTGLDPLAKQLHAVYRWDTRLGAEKMTIQTGIDGFRLIAQRTGVYGGQDDTKFHVETIYNPVTDADVKQLVATTTIYRINPDTGERMPVTATARWNEYVQKRKDSKTGQMVISGLWVTMPYNQLAKCSEALALRKGFPQELSGLYTDEEMAQADKPIHDLLLPASIIAKKEAHDEKVKEEKKEEVKPVEVPIDPKKPVNVGSPLESKILNQHKTMEKEQGGDKK